MCQLGTLETLAWEVVQIPPISGGVSDSSPNNEMKASRVTISTKTHLGDSRDFPRKEDLRTEVL